MDQKALVSAALAGLLACGPAAVAEDKREKCWGAAKAGRNACGVPGAEHHCARKSRVDYDPYDFVWVKAGTCLDMGGSLKAGEPGRLAKEKARAR